MRPDNQPITCCEAETYLSLFVEDELDPLRSNLLESHLGTCDSCRLLREELSSERLWILENSIHSPSLGADFASKICGKIREEDLPGFSLKTRLRKAAGWGAGWAGMAAAGILLALLSFGFFANRKAPEPEGSVASVTIAGARERFSAIEEAPGTAGSTLVSLVSNSGPEVDRTDHSSFCSPESPEGYILCTPVDAPASTLPDPSSLAGSGNNPNVEFVAFPPEVSPAIKPIKVLSAGLNQLDLGQLFGLFARRYEKVITTVAKPISLDDPCLDDLNDDGKVDGGDVAYGCLLLLESKPTAPGSDPDDETEETPDCDNREPCV